MQIDYLSWPLLPDLLPQSFPGVKTSRDDFVIDIDRQRLEHRIRQYFDPSVDHEAIRQLMPSAMPISEKGKAEVTRDFLRKRGFRADWIVRYCYRPFDVRWLFWDGEAKLLDRNRSEYVPHVFSGNIWLEARQKQIMTHFDRGYVTTALADNFGNGLSNFFPLYLRPPQTIQARFDETGASDLRRLPNGLLLNLSESVITYLTQINAMPDAESLFYHFVAILHAPSYRVENSGALRQDWPRIPLPASRDALLASAALGRQIAALLDTEHPVPGVTQSPVRAELKPIAVLARAGGGSLNPAAGDLDVTAGWGHAGKEGVTMPGRGRVMERPRQTFEVFGNLEGLQAATTLDIYLNDHAYWRNIPARVWDYTIGGYQVIKKWLSYREKALLERGLSIEEAQEVTHMARRIAALVLLEGTLDANYRSVAGAVYAWESK
jgi:hypothetical protein